MSARAPLPRPDLEWCPGEGKKADGQHAHCPDCGAVARAWRTAGCGGAFAIVEHARRVKEAPDA